MGQWKVHSSWREPNDSQALEQSDKEWLNVQELASLLAC
jgi:hypothetical protein